MYIFVFFFIWINKHRFLSIDDRESYLFSTRRTRDLRINKTREIGIGNLEKFKLEIFRFKNFFFMSEKEKERVYVIDLVERI